VPGDALRAVLDWLAGFGPTGLYVAALLLAAAETAIFLDLLVPGEVGLALVATAAASADDVSVVVVVAAAAVGATIGDCVSFAVGRRWGTSLLERGERRVHGIERARRAFDRHAGGAVFLARWVGVLRAVVPVVAGSSSMSVRRFLVWNVAASITWASAVVGVAYVAGPRAVEIIDRLGWGAAAIVVIGIAGLVLYRRVRRSRRDDVRAPASRSPGPSPTSRAA
jgi:membrane-associated protein